MTDLTAKLDALSERSAKGPWTADLHLITSEEEGLIFAYEGGPHWDSTEEASAEFVAALVNAYRAGKLIVKEGE